MEHETKLSAYTRSLRQTAVMPRFFIGQEVKTEHGIGIIVAIEMPYNGLYLQSERDEADLDNAKHHAQQTICFIEDLLLNIDGSIEEKLQFISKIKEEIPKFYGKG